MTADGVRIIIASPADSLFSNSPYPVADQDSATIEMGVDAWELKDPAEAAAYYRRCVERGHSVAMSRLGRMCQEGLGVAQNDVEAVRLYTRAAEKGLPGAMNNLGCMYHEGRGVPKDEGEALKLFRSGAVRGNPEARRNYDALSTTLSHVGH